MHTVLEMAEPVTMCWAAVILSVMLCPDILDHTECSITTDHASLPGSPASVQWISTGSLDLTKLGDERREGGRQEEEDDDRRRIRLGKQVPAEQKRDDCTRTRGFNPDTASVFKHDKILTW